MVSYSSCPSPSSLSSGTVQRLDGVTYTTASGSASERVEGSIVIVIVEIVVVDVAAARYYVLCWWVCLWLWCE